MESKSNLLAKLTFVATVIGAAGGIAAAVFGYLTWKTVAGSAAAASMPTNKATPVPAASAAPFETPIMLEYKTPASEASASPMQWGKKRP